MSQENIKPFNGKNFQVWEFRVTTAVEKLALEKYLESDVYKDTKDKAKGDKEKLNEVKKNNATVREILINAIDDEILHDFINIKSPFQIMQKLRKKYGGGETDIRYWIRKLNNLKAKNTEEITYVLDEMFSIFETLEGKKQVISDREKLKFMYDSMPKNFRNYLDIDEDTKPQELYNKINKKLNMIAYLEGGKDYNYYYQDDPMEIDIVEKSRKNSKYNNELKERLHKNYIKNCEEKRYCHICEIFGHTTRECRYNLKYTKQNSKNREHKKNYHNKNHYQRNNNFNKNRLVAQIEKSDEEENYVDTLDYEEICQLAKGNINLVEEMKHSEEHDNTEKGLFNIYNKEETTEWLYDCGACEHITNNKNLLTNYTKSPNELLCANGSKFSYDGFGEYEFQINDTKIKLKRVLYSPDVTRNIISAIELAKIGIKTITEPLNKNSNIVKLTLMDSNNKIIHNIFSTKSNQFLLHVNNVKMLDKNEIMSINDSKMTWHRRLGHFYNKEMEKYLKDHDVSEPDCLDCKIAKMKRSPHNRETPKASELLEVIHSDIIGPINKSITGKRFILTIIDEFSRKSWIFLLKSKSETIDIIINMFKFLNNIFKENKIKYFKSDNGREYNNRKILEFCKNNGIRKIYSPPYNPENNGLAERFNQTIISCAKTLLFWSKLSENFWDFAIIYANYIYNKVPHSGIDNKIPEEIFYNKKVNLKYIKVFGCIAYYKDYSQDKGKFDSNAKRNISGI